MQRKRKRESEAPKLDRMETYAEQKRWNFALQLHRNLFILFIRASHRAPVTNNAVGHKRPREWQKEFVALSCTRPAA